MKRQCETYCRERRANNQQSLSAAKVLGEAERGSRACVKARPEFDNTNLFGGCYTDRRGVGGLKSGMYGISLDIVKGRSKMRAYNLSVTTMYKLGGARLQSP